MKRVVSVLSVAACLAVGGCKNTAQPALEQIFEPTPSPIATILSSPSDSPSASPTAEVTQSIKTPEEVVKYYFDRWAVKDADGVESVLVKNLQGGEFDFDHMINMELLECKEVQNLSDAQLTHFEELGYKAAYEKTVVKVVFTVEYDDSGYDGGFGPGKSTGPWSFSLVRETESSDWVIVSYGA